MSILDRVRDAFLFYRTRRERERCLPLNEAVSDRFAYAKELGFGEGSSIYASTYVYNPERIKVGKNTWIGPNVILDASGGEIEIGNFCSISAGVQIYTHDSRKWANSLGKEPITRGPSVSIGNGVHVGPYTIICRGSYVESQVNIRAHSFVYGYYPPSIVERIEGME